MGCPGRVFACNTWALVNAHDRLPCLHRFSISIQNILQPQDELGAQRRDAPLYFLPRVKCVFFNVSRTVSYEIGVSMTFSSTNLSSNSCNVQLPALRGHRCTLMPPRRLLAWHLVSCVVLVSTHPQSASRLLTAAVSVVTTVSGVTPKGSTISTSGFPSALHNSICAR